MTLQRGGGLCIPILYASNPNHRIPKFLLAAAQQVSMPRTCRHNGPTQVRLPVTAKILIRSLAGRPSHLDHSTVIVPRQIVHRQDSASDSPAGKIHNVLPEHELNTRLMIRPCLRGIADKSVQRPGTKRFQHSDVHGGPVERSGRREDLPWSRSLEHIVLHQRLTQNRLNELHGDIAAHTDRRRFRHGCR